MVSFDQKLSHFAHRLYICQSKLSQTLLSAPLKEQENIKTEKIVSHYSPGKV